jgi:hypothetical protein
MISFSEKRLIENGDYGAHEDYRGPPRISIISFEFFVCFVFITAQEFD